MSELTLAALHRVSLAEGASSSSGMLFHKDSSTASAATQPAPLSRRLCWTECIIMLYSGQNLLLDIPVSILYEITKRLQVRSQCHLFLASSYLYSKWRLQILEEDHNWHFLSSCLDFLAHTSSDCISERTKCHVTAQCNTDLTKVCVCCPLPDGQFWYKSWSGPAEARSYSAGLYVWLTNDLRSSPTREFLLHKISGGLGLLRASMAWRVKPHANRYELQSAGQQLFDRLGQTRGFLKLVFDDTWEPTENDLYEMPSCLLITHYDGDWTIDGVVCILSPPKLDFDLMPRSIMSVEAKFYSKGVAKTVWGEDVAEAQERAEFDPSYEAKTAFAYEGNVEFTAPNADGSIQSGDYESSEPDWTGSESSFANDTSEDDDMQQ